MKLSLPDRPNLPALSEIRDRALPAGRRERLAPLFFAGGLLTLGAILLKTKPRLAQVPAPKQFGTLPRRSRLRRGAMTARDHIEPFAPTNVTDQIGRSLLLGGAALLLTRLLDEAAGRDGQ